MKQLFLLRHAIAVERGKERKDTDARRPLTSEGESKMRRIAKGMRKLGLEFDLILSSPCVRTRQTAEIVAEEFKMKDSLKLSEHLAPEGDSEDLIKDLKRLHPPSRSVLLVGHEPKLSALISTLLSGKPELEIVMKKGGLCLLSVNRLEFGRCATLEWLLTPRQLARMR